MARNHGFYRRIEGGRAISDEAIAGMILALRKVMIGGSHLSSRGRNNKLKGACWLFCGASWVALMGWSSWAGLSRAFSFFSDRTFSFSFCKTKQTQLLI